MMIAVAQLMNFPFKQTDNEISTSHNSVSSELITGTALLPTFIAVSKSFYGGWGGATQFNPVILVHPRYNIILF